VLFADDLRLQLEGLNNLLTEHAIRAVGMARDGLALVLSDPSLQAIMPVGTAILVLSPLASRAFKKWGCKISSAADLGKEA
jgi:hypothetical protein